MKAGLSDLIIVDSHNDSIEAHIHRGIGFSKHYSPKEYSSEGLSSLLSSIIPHSIESEAQLNFSKMSLGGIDVGYFFIDVTLARNNHLAYFMDALGFFFKEVERLSQKVVLVRSYKDIIEAKNSGRIAVILAMENSDGLERNLNILVVLYKLGIRVLGITHNFRSWAADGNSECMFGSGLTSFGRELVNTMNELGILIDVSHINERGFFDILDTTDKPIMVSHACCRALCDHARNINDTQLQALARNGGVIGITFVPEFLSKDNPTLELLYKHIDHAVEVAGIDHVGIGSDFDGGGRIIKDATEYSIIAKELLQRGYYETDVKKILGENHLRVFRSVCG